MQGLENEVKERGRCENTKIGEKQTREKLERKSSMDIKLGFRVQRWEENDDDDDEGQQGN